MGFGYSSGPAVTVTQPAVFVARLSPMLDPDEALHYLDFLESRAVAGEDEPPRDAASTALAAAPHALPSRTAPALEVSASKMDDGLPSPTAAELEDERVRDAVALLGRLIADDPREIAKKKARKRARRAMRAASAELLVLPAWLLTPKSPPKARPEIAPVKMPKIAPWPSGDYAAILDREQAAFDAAEFTTADLDAPAPYVGVGSAQDPLVVRLRNLRRRSWLSRVRGSRWSGTDAELVTAYNAEKTKAQARRRRAAQTAPCVYDAYARRVPISAPS